MILPIRLFAEAAAATYVPTAVPLFEGDGKTARIFESEVDGVRCYSFEGTYDALGWIVDFLTVEVPCFQHPKFGPVHLGILNDIDAVCPRLATHLGSLGWPPYLLAGHSKGAMDAILAHAWMKDAGHPSLATRAFEPAKIGGATLAGYLAGEDILWTQTRNAHGADIVTLVPDGPTWLHLPQPQGPIEIAVPDALGLADKHRIAAVLAALPA